MLNLDDKRALVTGASSGIGAAVAQALHAEGARLILAARNRSRLDAVAAALPGSETLELDVRDWAAVQRALGDLEVDICVANAGLGLGLGPLQSGAPEDWSEMIDTNLKGLLHTVRAVLPGMIARGSGDVVLLGSVAGRQVYAGGNVYCATKWGVRGVYEALRVDVPQPEIRITSVDPGMVKTDFSRVRFKGDEERAARVYEGVEHLNPEDVADVIRYVVTRPRHVNIGEVVMWASAQASASQVERKGS